VLGSPRRSEAVGFFVDLLGGAAAEDAAGATTVVWPGGGRIRIEDAARAGVLRLEASGLRPRRASLAGVPLVVA
jgi:hypothetical protein